jgi:hypothetical protein
MKTATLLALPLVVVLALACSSESYDATGAVEQADFPGCTLPQDVSIKATENGCYATPLTLCSVSNGATILPDGGVASGTDSCPSYCNPGAYGMACVASSVESAPVIPEPTLNCDLPPLAAAGQGAIFGEGTTQWYCCACL